MGVRRIIKLACIQKEKGRIQMAGKKRKKGINPGVFFTIIFIFTVISISMVWSLQVKASEVTKVNQMLHMEQKEKEELQLTIEKMTEKLESLEKEFKELELKNMARIEKESNQKVAYLTFDDGPSKNTVRILDILKEKDVKATFFVVGRQDMDHVYKRIVDEGHTIGNHTYGHDYNMIYKSPDEFFSDVDKLNDLLEKATGERTKILRFPGGSNNTVSRRAGGQGIMDVMTQAAKDNGYRYFDWNVDSQDASKAKQSKDVIVRSVLNGANNTKQAVILMHDAPAKTTTADALPEVIEGLAKKGFIFKGLEMHTPEVQF